MPQHQIIKCETSLDLLQHVDHHKFQQINNYRHTQTTIEGNGLERREISLICQYKRTRVLEASGTSWSANLQNKVQIPPQQSSP